MRSVRLPLLTLLLCLSSLPRCDAQEVTVSVGAVIKYSGIATDEKDLQNLKSIKEFLNTLESQIAKEFVNHTEVDYLDRMNTEATFRELHLSSNSNFDPSSGALRGLLGRLDYLIVIDSAQPSAARIRLIDVQSGAVKAIESCTQKSRILSFGSEGPPDCVGPFVNHSVAVMHAKRASKEERARQQTAARLASQKQAALEQERERERAAAEAKEQANAAAEARKAAEQEAAAEAHIAQQLTSMQPDLDDALSRLSGQNDFWRDLSQQLASAGQSLRPSINSGLKSANSDADRCKQLFNDRNPDELHECITRLDSDLEKLDKLKD